MTPTDLLSPAPAAPPTARPLPLRIDLALLQQRVRDLPALPQAAMDALALLQDTESTVPQCADALARDPALTARVLGLANSAFFGARGKVASVAGAIQVLGRRSVTALLATATVSQAFRPAAGAGTGAGAGAGAGDLIPFDFSAFWRHTLATALAAQGIARERREDDGLAFTAGLLHDIGVLALATHFPAELGAVTRWAHAHDCSQLDAEHAVLGAAVDHTRIGGMIATHWHFPANVTAAIRWHHQPAAASPPPGSDPAISAAVRDLAACVHAADALAHALDIGHTDHEGVPPLDPAAWAHLALSPDACLRVLAHTESGVEALCVALAL